MPRMDDQEFDDLKLVRSDELHFRLWRELRMRELRMEAKRARDSEARLIDALREIASGDPGWSSCVDIARAALKGAE